MDPKFKIIANMSAASMPVEEIARRMGMTEEWVLDILSIPKVEEAIAAIESPEVDDTKLYSPEEIKFFVEKMFPKALKVIESVLETPGNVTATQWKATEWVLAKANAIQEMTKEVDGARVVNQFFLNDRAAGALEKLGLESADWWAKLDESLQELPDGIE